MTELAQRTCVPCRGGVPPLTDDEIAPFLAQVDPEWRVIERTDAKRGPVKLLAREYRFKNFAEALRGAVRIGDMAEQQAHHPDLLVAWGRLEVEVWTHKIGGLTESDFVFAAKCDALLRERFFEDYVPGSVYEFGSVTLSEDEIIEFARRYDPQYFHVDPARAASGPFDGLIASGWQTGAVIMRLFVDHYLAQAPSFGSPGMDEIRWLRPARPGDRLRIRVTVLESRVSRSKPDRGIVKASIEAFNQRDELVATMIGSNFIGRRPSSS